MPWTILNINAFMKKRNNFCRYFFLPFWTHFAFNLNRTPIAYTKKTDRITTHPKTNTGTLFYVDIVYISFFDCFVFWFLHFVFFTVVNICYFFRWLLFINWSRLGKVSSKICHHSESETNIKWLYVRLNLNVFKTWSIRNSDLFLSSI